jgi:hypothetical protein
MAEGPEESIVATIRLGLNELKRDAEQALANIQVLTERLKIKTEVAGREIGGNLGNGFVEYFKGGGEVERKFNEFFNKVVSMAGGTQTKLGGIAHKTAQGFANPLLQVLPKIATTLNAGFGAIGQFMQILSKVGEGLKKVAAAVHDHNVQVKESAAVSAILSGNVKEADRALAAYEKTVQTAKDRTEELRQKNLEVIESYQQYKTALGDLELQFASGRMSREQFVSGNLSHEQMRLEEFTAAIYELSPTVTTAINDLNRLKREHSETIVEYNRLMAEGSREEARLYAADMAMIAEAERKVAKLQGELKTANETADKQREKVEGLRRTAATGAAPSKAPKPAEETREEKIAAARLAAVERYRRAAQAAQDAKLAGLLTEEERVKQVDAALATQYADLEAIVAEYRLTAGETVRLRDESAATLKIKQEAAALAEQERKKTADRAAGQALLEQAEAERLQLMVEMADTLAQQEIERERANGNVKEAVRLEVDLTLKQRERAREALMASRAFIHAGAAAQAKMLKDFDTITDEMVRTAEASGQKIAKGLFDGAGWQTGTQLAQEAVNTFADIASAFSQIRTAQVEQEVAAIDALLAQELESIERLRQQALEDAGFAEASTEASFEKQIAAAQQANDEVLQYQLERRREEKRINDTYDKQAQAAEAQAEYDKAQLQYEADTVAWNAQIAMLPFNTALMMMNAFSSGWAAGTALAVPGLAPALAGVYSGMALAQGIAQGAVMQATKPQPPTLKFDSGGIVPGRAFNGDTVSAQLNSGERILTMDNQEFMLEAAGAGKPIRIENRIYLDSRIIGESTADVFNTVGAMLETRALRR